MAWEVYVLDEINPSDLTEKGLWQAPLPTLPKIENVDTTTVSHWLQNDSNIIAMDFSTHAHYVNGHIPGSWYALRSQLAEAMKKIPQVDRYVITSSTSELSLFAAQELQTLTDAEVLALEGDNPSWVKAGLELEKGPSHPGPLHLSATSGPTRAQT
ncbi:rhodanese-like domain-containing protein [Polynucleobacter necessarius]|uniref:rhodanese-like domain-containing protein n=1 Tax=Polynucleobacter necessarius TaxID=576610 RepID=UPI002F9328A1